MKVIDGKKIAAEMREELKKEVEKLETSGIIPGLAVILVGEDSASQVYVNNKEKLCKAMNINSFVYRLPAGVSERELIDLIDELNEREDVNGILLQHPTPKHIDEAAAFNRIKPEKDVDGFNVINMGSLAAGESCIAACTPEGIVDILQHEKIKIEGEHCVIIGRSNIVGNPLSKLMLNENATVTVCHSKTKNLKEICKAADILIVAVGNPKFIKADMIKSNAVVIDVGINKVNGKLVGDVDFEDVKDKVSYITPVPGGVGPMTMIILIKHVIELTKRQKNII